MRIVNNIPGRIRVAHPELKDERTMADVLGRMQKIDGLISPPGQPATGSEVMRHDADMMKDPDRKRAFFSSDRKSPQMQPSAEKSPQPPKPGKIRRDLLQAVMLGSLLFCVVTAFAGPRLFHLLSGMIFLLTAAGHTCVNHRRLFYEARHRFF